MKAMATIHIDCHAPFLFFATIVPCLLAWGAVAFFAHLVPPLVLTTLCIIYALTLTTELWRVQPQYPIASWSVLAVHS